MTELPPPRRVVTGHDTAGNAIFVADSKVPVVSVDETIDFAVLYETHQFPASNDRWADPILQRTTSLANKDGVVLRVVDFKPNNRSLFHRTESLDFGIILEGEIVCRLDNNVENTLRAGDTCVQRGTIHSWENRTDKTARVLFVLIAAEPVKAGDQTLGSEGFDPNEMGTGGVDEERA
ncbi:cupin 2 domain-containing protein [Ilyonectria destructans]|nr:cupin 2 domain-containing protein [Ilyonectria destructans]